MHGGAGHDQFDGGYFTRARPHDPAAPDQLTSFLRQTRWDGAGVDSLSPYRVII